MMTIADVLQELEQEAATTRRVLERVPGDRLGWKPHEKSMTLGRLAMHVATLPGAIADMASRPSFDAGTRVPQPEAKSTAEILALLDESLKKAAKIVGGLDDATLASPWKMTAGEKVLISATRAWVLRTVLLNHWVHHRGQLTVYLRLNGIPVPSIYGPSADENPLTPSS